MEALQTVHRFTVADYRAMGVAGILPERGVELIEGQVVEMSPIGPRHGAAVDRLTRLFVFAFGTSAIVRVQGAIVLPPFSEPEADLLVLEETATFYADRGPFGSDALLAVEVAESSLAKDMRVKAPLYARGGIPEYWIVDLQCDVLLVYRLVDAGRYGEPERHVDGAISPERFPAVTFDVAELLATGR